MESKEKKSIDCAKWMKVVSIAGLLISVVLCLIGWKMGLFSSQENLRRFVSGFGLWGPLIFVAIQAIQVVVPILPGGIGCLAGVLLFGALPGFLYNYIGICIGSVLAFLIARSCGRPMLFWMFGEKRMKKYGKWMATGSRFTKLFAVAIFLPVAPDDFLCYWAGTTEMSLPTFTGIILLGKPFAIAMYSLGLTAIFTRLAA